MRLRLAAACAAALLTAACQTPQATISRLAAPLAADPPTLRTALPETPGLHPAVLIVPACDAPLVSSRAALYTRYAENLKAEGFAAGILAWPGSGAGDPSCNTIAPAKIASAILGAVKALQAQPGVDPRRLHLVGWGHGGRGVLEIVMADKRLTGLVSAIAVYPDCPKPEAWKTNVTLFLALGENDAVNPPADCRAWAEKSDGPAPIAITRYEDVGYGFDVAEAGDAAFAAYMTGTPLTFDASTEWQFGIDLLKFLRLKIDAGA